VEHPPERASLEKNEKTVMESGINNQENEFIGRAKEIP
jgi:hypothetical protein